MTIKEAITTARSSLDEISDAPDLDAAWLVLKAVDQQDNAWLISHGDSPLTASQYTLFQDGLARRKEGEPLAYIFGHWDFYGRRFFVTSDVLIPRPSSEQLIDAALERTRDLNSKLGRKITVWDLGTGSGIVAITLALESPLIEHIFATDISAFALAVAAKNARQHGVNNKITFLLGDMLEPVSNLKIDLLVSNPPYLPAEALAKAGCSAETRGLNFEPCIALDGGSDGQQFLKQIRSWKIPAVIETTGGEIEVSNR